MFKRTYSGEHMQTPACTNPNYSNHRSLSAEKTRYDTYYFLKDRGSLNMTANSSVLAICQLSDISGCHSTSTYLGPKFTLK